MNRTPHSVLRNVFHYLGAVGVTLSDLLQFILVSGQLNDTSHALYRDLLANTTSILSAFYYHPATADSTRAWAHNAMCTVYSGYVYDLSLPQHGQHFSATRVTPQQLRDFRIEDLATRLESQAPILWTLVQSLLRGPMQNSASIPATGYVDPMSADSDSDSEDEYWMEEDSGLLEVGQGEGGGHGVPASEGGGRSRGQRRTSQETVYRIRTVVIISILLSSRDQRCNAMQSIIGIFLHACNTPEKVVKLLSRMGVSISQTSIHRAVYSLSEEATHDIRDLGQTRLAAYAYDNLEFLLPTGIPTVERPGDGLLHLTSGTLLRLEHGITLDDLRCSRLLWDRSEYNPNASDPRPFDPYKTMQFLYMLHREPDYPIGELSRRGRFRSWMFQRTLFEHGPSGLRHFASLLPHPECIDQIPMTKLHHVPLRTMDVNQSTVSGNIEALRRMFGQAGVGDPNTHTSGEDDIIDLSEFVTIVHGDLGTYERVLSAIRRRSVEDSELDRLQGIVFAIGFFHFKMAAADAIWRIHVSPDRARSDETSFIKLVGKLRPKESSRLIAGAKFRQQHELIGHVLTLLQLDAWRVEVERRTGFITLEEWVASKPKLADIGEIANNIVCNYVEGDGVDLFELECLPSSARDKLRENTMRTLNHLLLYEELCYAMNAGDIGRVETLLAPWIQIFRSTGKHKYGTQTLRFVHALYFIYPDGLRRTVRYNIFVNPSGKAHAFRAVDWVVELLNLYTKVIYGGEGSNYTKARILLESVLVLVYRGSHANIERNFALPGLTDAHAMKDMDETFKFVLEYLKTQRVNEYRKGRQSHYVVPNILVQRASIIEQEATLMRGGSVAATTIVTGGEEDGDRSQVDEDEERQAELTVDDLSVDGLL